MFETDPPLMKKGIFALVAMCAFPIIALVATSSVLGWFLGPLAICIIWFAFRAIYVTERFVEFFSFGVSVTIVAIALWTSAAVFFSISNAQAKLPCVAYAIVTLPLALSALGMWCACRAKAGVSPFVISGDRVVVQTSGGKLSGGLIGGVVALISWGMMKALGHENILILAATMLEAGAIALIFHYRNAVRALRSMQAVESKSGIRYTFNNVEEVRAARAHWWMGRLLNVSRD